MIQAEAMRRARLKAGMRICDLSRATGVSHVTIHDFENPIKNRCGRLDTITLLADELGLSIDEYVGHEVRRSADAEE